MPSASALVIVTKYGLEPGLEKLGVSGIRWHDLRHTAASLWIAQGLDVVFVARQLGHSSPALTLGVYAHLFDGARHADRARDKLEAEFGSVLGG